MRLLINGIDLSKYLRLLNRQQFLLELNFTVSYHIIELTITSWNDHFCWRKMFGRLT